MQKLKADPPFLCRRLRLCSSSRNEGARSSALGSGSKTSDRCDRIYPELSIRNGCDRSEGELRLSQPSYRRGALQYGLTLSGMAAHTEICEHCRLRMQRQSRTRLSVSTRPAAAADGISAPQPSLTRSLTSLCVPHPDPIAIPLAASRASAPLRTRLQLSHACTGTGTHRAAHAGSAPTCAAARFQSM